jgi:hypothetical protein
MKFPGAFDRFVCFQDKYVKFVVVLLRCRDGTFASHARLPSQSGEVGKEKLGQEGFPKQNVGATYAFRLKTAEHSCRLQQGPSVETPVCKPIRGDGGRKQQTCARTARFHSKQGRC